MPKYTTPYGGREIYRYDKPFATVAPHPAATQTTDLFIDVSDFGRLAARAPALRLALADLLDAMPAPRSRKVTAAWHAAYEALRAARGEG